MSNGGYKGASPARETSPEQYPGVWELTEQFQAQADGNWPFQADDCAPKSLRFDGSSAYLSRTLAAGSDRRTWTMSMWVKRGKLGVFQDLFGAGQESTNDGKYARFSFMDDDTFRLRFWTEGGSLDANLQTTRVFRDCSAFYHFVIRHNSRETNQQDRLRIYINGELITSYGSPDYLSQDVEGHWNFANKTQMIGAHYDGGNANEDSYFDGYISEVIHIDGQSLPPEEFAFEDGQGIWQPKRFTGDYSNGPVYSNSSDANGVVSSGNLSLLFDGNTTTNVNISNSNSYAIATQNQSIPVTSTIGMWTITGASYPTMRVTDTNGTVTVLDHNDTPIVNGGWTDFSYSGTVAKIELAYIPGSGSNNAFYALRVDGVTLTDASVGRNSFHLDFSDGAKDQSGLGNDWTTNNIATAEFDAVANTTHVGPGTLTNLATATYYNLFHVDSNQVSSNPGSAALARFNFSALGLTAPATITFDSYEQGGGGWGTVSSNIYTDAGTVTSTSTSSGNTRSNTVNIPAGATYFEIPGSYNASYQLYYNGINNLVWNGVSYQHATEADVDTFVDSPVNGNEASTSAGGQRRGNYATLSPLLNTVATLSNGNLLYTAHGSTQHCVGSTIAVSSGKYYWEYTIETAGTYHYAGIADIDTPFTTNWCGSNSGWSIGINGAGNISWNNAENHGGIGISASSGQTWGWALDMDAGTLHVYVNGVIRFSGNSIVPSNTSLIGRRITPAAGHSANKSLTFNFGQRPFKYQNAGTNRPSADYKPLATSFMPEPTIKRGDEAMDVALWTGTSSNNKIGNFRLSPDLVWIKNRTDSSHHHVYDIIRGAGKRLKANENHVEDNYASTNPSSSLLSFNKDGFTVGDFNGINGNSDSMVGWAWDAGDTTTTIAVGGLNSSAYDQSQTWSNSLSATFRGTEPATNAFDGNTSTIAGSGGSITYTSPVAVASSSTIRVFVHGGDHNVSVNSGANQTVAAGSFVTLNFTNPTNNTFTITFDRVGSADTGVRAIEIGGRLLVDNGVSVTNVPSIATTVRARPETGFSILNYSASGTAGASVAHQLGKAPEFMIAKARNHGQNWFLFHKTVGAGGGFNFNDNTAAYTTDTGYWNGNDPDAYKITLGNYHGYAATHDFVLYAWTSVKGYSSFGSYEGSNSSLPYIYTDFSPRWILIANMDNVNDYVIYDTARDANNQSSTVLAVNSNNPESSYSTGYELDILSNGFKIRTSSSGAINQNAHTHVYAAFASHPFASNARAR